MRANVIIQWAGKGVAFDYLLQALHMTDALPSFAELFLLVRGRLHQ